MDISVEMYLYLYLCRARWHSNLHTNSIRFSHKNSFVFIVLVSFICVLIYFCALAMFTVFFPALQTTLSVFISIWTLSRDNFNCSSRPCRPCALSGFQGFWHSHSNSLFLFSRISFQSICIAMGAGSASIKGLLETKHN